MFISLGGNCSITYQLNKHKLRYEAYPFDWCKISMCSLIQVLKNEFKDFHKIISYSTSYKHKQYDDNNNIISNHSVIFKNNYCSFAHTYDNVFMLSESLERRIQRFKHLSFLSLSHHNQHNEYEIDNQYDNEKKEEKQNNELSLVFVRLEYTRPKLKYMNQLIELCKVLNEYFDEFVIKLIIHQSFQHYYDNYEWKENREKYKIEIIYFEEFDEDWKFDFLNWPKIFDLII